MAFFARPNLSDEQFKQLQGTTLTLSGQTQITTVSGLTLANNSIGTVYPNIVITAEDADTHVGHVLTYDGYGKICLRSPSAVGGDPVYNPPYKSPAAVTLCGIQQGFVLTGKTISCILETLLVPTLPATVVEPYHQSMSINPSTTLYEVGYTIAALQVTSVFNRGSITPYYGATPPSSSLPSVCRSGPASTYNYIVQGAVCPVTSSNPYTLAPLTIQFGSNNISGRVSYGAGTYAVYDSSGTQTAPALGPGTTTPAQQITLTGIYPYFYGKVSGSRPSIATIGTCITAGCGKTVLNSNAPITITWSSVAGDYIWFATPIESATKTKWQNTVTTVDNGDIGGAVTPGGNLFPDPQNVSPTSTIWANAAGGSPHAYKVYISNYSLVASQPYLLS